MLINPYERIKKKKEEKELAKKQEEFDRARYKRLGLQMGLADLPPGTSIPSFMRELLSKDDRSNPVSRPPVPDALQDNNLPHPPNMNYENANDNISVDPRVIQEKKARIANFEDKINNLLNSSDGKISSLSDIGSLPENRFDREETQFKKSSSLPHITGFPGTQIMNQNLNESHNNFSFDTTYETNTDNLQIDDTFDETEKNNHLLTVNDVVKKMLDARWNDQFIGVSGDYRNVQDTINELLTKMKGVNTIRIKAKRMFLYHSPYLFLLKQIINSIPIASLEDKKVLWTRASVLMGTVENQSINKMRDEQIAKMLDFTDPLLSIRDEFIDILNAYKINRPLCIILDDFRGVNFNKTNDLINLITSIFYSITNIKFIVDINESAVKGHFKNDQAAYNDWLALFDAMIIQKNKEITFKKNNEDLNTHFSSEFSNLNIKQDYQVPKDVLDKIPDPIKKFAEEPVLKNDEPKAPTVSNSSEPNVSLDKLHHRRIIIKPEDYLNK